MKEEKKEIDRICRYLADVCSSPSVTVVVVVTAAHYYYSTKQTEINNESSYAILSFFSLVSPIYKDVVAVVVV